MKVKNTTNSGLLCFFSPLIHTVVVMLSQTNEMLGQCTAKSTER
jgi:hypothetical protein